MFRRLYLISDFFSSTGKAFAFARAHVDDLPVFFPEYTYYIDSKKKKKFNKSLKHENGNMKFLLTLRSLFHNKQDESEHKLPLSR